MVMMLGRCELFAVPAALVSRGATIAGLMSRRCEIRIKTNQEKRCSALCSLLWDSTARGYLPKIRTPVQAGGALEEAQAGRGSRRRETYRVISEKN